MFRHNLWDYSSDSTPIAKHFLKEQCTEINIGDLNTKKIINVNCKLNNSELQE